MTQIADEVFSLTKINWNSTQMNQKFPIRAARKVGEVLKYVKDGQTVSSDYRKYIWADWLLGGSTTQERIDHCRSVRSSGILLHDDIRQVCPVDAVHRYYDALNADLAL